MDQLVPSMKLVADGLTYLSASDFPPEKYDEFQAIAEGLVQAKAHGFLHKVAVERSKSRETYGHITQVVVAGGLTPSGKQWLAEEAEYEEKGATRIALKAAKAPVEKQPEILQLKPAFMGVSVDLKALWRKFVAWRGGNV